jgi:hypothetical protein
MQQSRAVVAGLVRRLASGQSDAPVAINLGLRHLSNTSSAQHVQPAPVDDLPSASSEDKPRWKRELGAIRTDWT